MKKSSKGFVTPYKDPTVGVNTTPSLTTSTTTKIALTPKITTTKKSTIQQNKKEEPTPTPTPTPTTTTTSNGERLIYYKIGWHANSGKKFKSYNDGYLMYDELKKTFNLYDHCGKDIGKTSILKIESIQLDEKVVISSKEVVVESIISLKDFQTSTGLESSSSSSLTNTSTTTTTIDKDTDSKTKTRKLTKKQQQKEDQKEQKEEEEERLKTTTTTTTNSLKKEFKSHTSLEEQKMGKKIVCLHDPNSKDALILYTPPENQLDKEGNKVVHVVLDPHITRNLRPHQKKGVKFLYDCVTGVSNENGHTGAILADEMGLGKTLQTLALLWTLLKQSPNGKPMIKKAMIVTPSTLVNNWKNEIQKWFGTSRLVASTLTDSLSKETKENLNDFNTSIKPVLIISYEQCRIFAKQLETMSCGLMVCDEAHRLKNSNAKTTMAINSVQVNRKILLTGTPIQNDLVEFHSMIDFANPNSLGTLAEFKKNYINPINKSRETNSTRDTQNDGVRKSMQLSKLTKPFILRRRSNILEKYLPPKRIHILFCQLSQLQIELYKSILNSNNVQSLLSSSGHSRGSASSLSTITLLKKLSNSPSLLFNNNNNNIDQQENNDNDEENNEIMNIFKKFNYNLDDQQNESGKLTFVENLIKQLKPIGEKLVLVSNYTQTLDVFERLCKRLSIDTLRLDGSVNSDLRQALVDKFNDPTNKSYQIFLLSAKAGGVGINLIGGNHLVLFDPDWNPAIDIQAQERIWREGQTKPVFIYRLFSTGTIEEKIYQRQLMKESISNSIVDKKFNDTGSFSIEDLKDIFSLNQLTNSDTHDLLQCNCGNNNHHYNGNNNNISKKSQILKTINHQDKWEHYNSVNQLSQKSKLDSILKKPLSNQQHPIDFIFISKPSKPLNEFEDDDNEISFLEIENQIKDDENDQLDDENDGNSTKITKITPKKRVNKKVVESDDDDDDDNDDDDDDDKHQINSRKRLKVNNIINDEDEDDLSNLDMS